VGSYDVGRRRQVQIWVWWLCMCAFVLRARLRGRAAGSAAWCPTAVVCGGDGVCVHSVAEGRCNRATRAYSRECLDFEHLQRSLAAPLFP
jgi:hypothetical protein